MSEMLKEAKKSGGEKSRQLERKQSEMVRNRRGKKPEVLEERRKGRNRKGMKRTPENCVARILHSQLSTGTVLANMQLHIDDERP